MKNRTLRHERLDESDISSEEIRSSLDFMGRVNRFLGGNSAVLDFFRAHAKGDRFTVLDLGTGAGDIPYALVRWARSESKDVSVTALDTNPLCLAYARRRHASDAIRYVEHSAFGLEELGDFDYIIASAFFHHLTDDEIVSLLKLIDRHAQKGFVVNDLYRGWLPWAGAFLLACTTRQHVLMNDAPLSVKRAFREADLRKYAEAAGIPDAVIERKPLYRISLARAK